jgi:RecB family endonuclease NucS
MVAERPQLIEPGLSIHEEDGVPAGVAFGTPVGEIDLLTRDSTGAWVLVLIPDQSREKELVTELLQLMGWVRKHLGQPSQEVRAIALLDWVPEDLGYAAAAVADTVEFKRYQLSLTFEALDV